MFILQPEPTFDADVVIPTPDGETKTLVLTFRHQGRRALRAWLDDVARAEPHQEAEVFAAVVVGWDADQPLSPHTLALLLDDYAMAARCVMDTYVQTLTEGRAKN